MSWHVGAIYQEERNIRKRQILWAVAGAASSLILTVAVLALLGCESKPAVPKACPGFERVNVGSGCRETATGQFVEMSACDC